MTPMQNRLSNPVTPDQIAAYRRDGVVCLRQMFSSEWIERLKAGAAEVIAHPDDWPHRGPSHGGMVSISYLWRQPGPFRDFALGAPVGELVGRVIGSDRVQMYHDHLFHKPTQSPTVMKWHADHLWPFQGGMLTNLWIALTPVNADNGRMEFIAGYHQHCVDNGLRFTKANPCPDFESLRDAQNFAFRFVTWDLEPGDALLFHFDTPHFSKGNASAVQGRTGLALRTLGDDVVWRPSDDLIPVIGIDPATVRAGSRPEETELLPVIWDRVSNAHGSGLDLEGR